MLSEQEWMALEAEVANLLDKPRRRAMLITRTAEKYRTLAAQKQTDPVDELLDLHAAVKTEQGKDLIAGMIDYLRTDKELGLGLRL